MNEELIKELKEASARFGRFMDNKQKTTLEEALHEGCLLQVAVKMLLKKLIEEE